jgi:DNA repair protein RadC
VTLTPKEEITVPKDLVEATQALGLTVHDRLIIDRGRHTSLRNQ